MRECIRLMVSALFVIALNDVAPLLPAAADELDMSKPYCAKPLSTIDAGLPTNLPSVGSIGTTLWPTRSIPIVPHQTLPKTEKDALISAAKYIQTISNVRFYVCDGHTAVTSTKIEGFVVAASFETVKCLPDKEKDDGLVAGCTNGIGMRNKLESKLPKTDEKILDLGLRWTVRVRPKTNTTATAVHELLHVLGMRHGQQSPAAKDDIAMDPDPKERLAAANCTFDKFGIAGTDGVTAQWLANYDPASIMHYGLGGKNGICKITLVGCKLKSTGTPKSEFISECNVDKVIDSGEPCGKKSSGKSCFVRPTIIFEKSDYGSSDFGQRNCASALDQAWLLSAYPESTALDAFGLKDEKTCTPVSEIQVSTTKSTR